MKELMKEYGDNKWVSVSATSRDARPGEKEGVDYFYLSKEEFELFWKIQELLSTYDFVKNQLNNNLCDTLENIKTLYIDVLEEKI